MNHEYMQCARYVRTSTTCQEVCHSCYEICRAGSGERQAELAEYWIAKWVPTFRYLPIPKQVAP